MSRSGISAILFDLDGTLVDSLPGIEASLRHTVERCLPGRLLPDLRPIIGPPVRAMMSRLWPNLTPEQLERAVSVFREHYDSEGCLHSPLYEGVGDTLRTLQNNGVTMFVLTNKPFAPARLILERNAIAMRFARIVSPDAVVPVLKSKREGAELLRREYRLGSEATIVIGDGYDDFEAAQACGFRFFLAAYGYGSAAVTTALPAAPRVKTFSDIARLVL